MQQDAGSGTDAQPNADATPGADANAPAGDASPNPDATEPPRDDAQPGADATPPADAGPTPDAGMADSGPTPDAGHLCWPDLDDVINRSEETFLPNLHANFRAASDTPIDLHGTAMMDGTRQWDFSGMMHGDQTIVIETLPVSGAWWESTFPHATYAAKLSQSSDLQGVFQATADALLLLGVVSPQGGLLRTELSYDPPVVVLSFPITPGKVWTTESTITGLATGAVAYATEAYRSEVDAKGLLVTPLTTFMVQRIQVVLHRTVGLLPTTIRTFMFVSDCFGTVGSVVSQDNESAVEFTTAAEVKRPSP
jgi:hypothetical protein